MNRSIAIALLMAIAPIAGANAGTQASGAGIEVQSRVVRYADLDLTNASGAATLYGRLQVAARSVCVSGNTSGLAEFAASHRCAADAVARAVADVNAPTLTSFYVAKVGHPLKDVPAMEAGSESRESRAHVGK